MSATGQWPRVEERAANENALSANESCAHCGSSLRDDQEWCLECGAARTLIHRPPDWRIAAAVILAVVGLALLGLAVALVNLSSNADSTALTRTAPKVSSAAARPAVTTPTPPGSHAIASWPVGLSGWTVALSRSRSQSEADATARRFAASGLHVGVLDTNQHPIMRPGFWIVFAGRYPGRAGAVTAAAGLRGKVSPATPVARRVAPPGGL